MRNQHGFTLVGVLVALVLMLMVVLMAFTLSGSLVGRESMKGAVYELQSYAQMARVEAVGRNRECRLLVNPTLRRALVTDSLTTTSTADDLVLYDTTLASTLLFEDPSAGPAVTLAEVPSTNPKWYEAVYVSDGTVRLGEGEVTLRSGDHFSRLEIFAGGGVRVQTWDGTAWSVEVY